IPGWAVASPSGGTMVSRCALRSRSYDSLPPKDLDIPYDGRREGHIIPRSRQNARSLTSYLDDRGPASSSNRPNSFAILRPIQGLARLNPTKKWKFLVFSLSRMWPQESRRLTRIPHDLSPVTRHRIRRRFVGPRLHCPSIGRCVPGIECSWLNALDAI